MKAAQRKSPFTPWNDDTAREIISRNKDRPGALMPILSDMVNTFGFINPDVVPEIADALNLSRAEVHGVITFYHDFRTTQPGRHVIKICRAESCQAMQAEELIEHAREKLGVDWHGTTDDGAYTLEPVYCLGNCACSPAVMIDEELHGRVTPERFDELTGTDRKAVS